MNKKNPNTKRGRKKSVAYCSVCEKKIGIKDSYIVGDKYCCKECMDKITRKRKRKI
tara:strand:+ start:57 stop:224 length:168 start_codon:yes stop_codon:yes gene_type:complete